MWKIEYTTPQGNFTARYINGDLLTDSVALEALVFSRIVENRTNPYIVSATAVGPAEPLNWDVPYLAYTFVANLIGEVFEPTAFTSSGQIYWPFEREEDIPEGVTSSGSPYLELLRNRAKANIDTTATEFHAEHDQKTHGSWAAITQIAKRFKEIGAEADALNQEAVEIGNNIDTAGPEEVQRAVTRIAEIQTAIKQLAEEERTLRSELEDYHREYAKTAPKRPWFQRNRASRILDLLDETVVGNWGMSAQTEQFHACGQHDCATHGNWANGKIETAGMEDWPADFREKVVNHVQSLQQRYGVRVSLDARPSSTKQEDGHTVIDVYNLAEENEALAAVDQEDTTIYLHPQFANGGWRARQLSATPGLASNVQDILTHEYAHALQGAIEQHGDQERLSRLKAPFLQVLDTDNESDFDQLASEVSFYATQTVDEAIAESFLQHHQGRKKTQWSEHVGSILRKEG